MIKFSFLIFWIFNILFCSFSFSQDLGTEFENLLKNNSSLEEIKGFLIDNEEYIDKVWINGSFLQIAANFKTFNVFINLLKLGVKNCDIPKNQREHFLSKAIETKNFKAIYFLLGKGNYKSLKILRHLYTSLLQDEQNPKNIANLAWSISNYIEEYEEKDLNILKEQKIDKLFNNLSQEQINFIVFNIISTPNLPTNKKFLLPFLGALQSNRWDYESYPKLFTNLAKLKSSICIPIIEELLKTICSILSEHNINNITWGIIEYLEFNKNLNIQNSEILEEILKILINKLLKSDKIINYYFCLRIIKNTISYSVKDIKMIINMIENYLSDKLNSYLSHSLEDKIYLFTSLLNLTDHKVCIKKYFSKICDLHYNIIKSKKLYYDEAISALRDIHLLGLLDFEKFDNGDYGLEKLNSLLRNSDTNSEKIHYIKIFLDKKLTKNNKILIRKNLKNLIAILVNEINVAYEISIEELQEICESLELSKLQNIFKNKIRNEQDLVKKVNNNELIIDRCNTSIINLKEFDCKQIQKIAKENPSQLIPILILCRNFVAFGNEQRGEIQIIQKYAESKEIILNKINLINMLISSQKQYEYKSLNLIAKIINKEELTAIKYCKGVICYYGEDCKNILFILKGIVESKIGDCLLKKYYEWDILGEMNLFKDNPKRTATLIAESECEILEIPIRLFEKKVKKNPEYLTYLIESLIKMIQENNKFIQENKED